MCLVGTSGTCEWRGFEVPPFRSSDEQTAQCFVAEVLLYTLEVPDTATSCTGMHGRQGWLNEWRATDV